MIRSETSKSGLAAGLLHDPDHVPGQALGGQLRRDLGVEHDHALAPPSGAAECSRSAARDQPQLVLALLERHPGGDRTTVHERPLAGLDRLDDLLHLPADARAERARHHGEHLLAVRRPRRR